MSIKGGRGVINAWRFQWFQPRPGAGRSPTTSEVNLPLLPSTYIPSDLGTCSGLCLHVASANRKRCFTGFDSSKESTDRAAEGYKRGKRGPKNIVSRRHLIQQHPAYFQPPWNDKPLGRLLVEWLWYAPNTKPISQEQLVAEVKGIYAGLVMVESKCIEVDGAAAAPSTGHLETVDFLGRIPASQYHRLEGVNPRHIIQTVLEMSVKERTEQGLCVPSSKECLKAFGAALKGTKSPPLWDEIVAALISIVLGVSKQGRKSIMDRKERLSFAQKVAKSIVAEFEAAELTNAERAAAPAATEEPDREREKLAAMKRDGESRKAAAMARRKAAVQEGEAAEPPTGSLAAKSSNSQSTSDSASDATSGAGGSATEPTAEPVPLVDIRPLEDKNIYKKVHGTWYFRAKGGWILSYDSGQNQALVDLHRTNWREHHDFLLASHHPRASPQLRALAKKYAMPARLWRHAIHEFLECMRHRLPDSFESMSQTVADTFALMCLLEETVPGLFEIWLECRADLARYRCVSYLVLICNRCTNQQELEWPLQTIRLAERFGTLSRRSSIPECCSRMTHWAVSTITWLFWRIQTTWDASSSI